VPENIQINHSSSFIITINHL